MYTSVFIYVSSLYIHKQGKDETEGMHTLSQHIYTPPISHKPHTFIYTQNKNGARIKAFDEKIKSHFG